jgi:hypothetical protein
VYLSTADTRDCTPCGCNVDGTPTCAGEVNEFTDGFCVVEFGGFQPDGGCHTSSVGGETNWGVAYDGTAPVYGCGNTGSTAVGEIEAAEPTTFCCTL